MKVPACMVVMVLLLSGLTLASGASRQSQAERGGAVSGQVRLGGTPVPGALVLAVPMPPASREAMGRGKTDANGNYRIANLVPGRYFVTASAPPLTSVETPGRGFSREITLDHGETRENVDFSLARGGVITGRVTDANGRPLIEEPISLSATSSARGLQPYYDGAQRMLTDDRGIYRIYGLPPGEYKVSVGIGSPSRGTLDYGQSYYPRTYHPGVVEDSKADIVEVTAGGEASGIDIAVGRRERTYQASGRLVDAETGQPQPGINWGYGGYSMSTFQSQSDENGGFKISGLMPGRYSVFAGCEGNYYSDRIEFEITNRDVTGLEIRRNRGASVSGKVVLEGVSDPAVLSGLTSVSLNATNGVVNVGSSIDPDGSFYFCGLRPGRVRVSAQSWRQQGFRLLRVEHNGEDLTQGIDVSPGDHVTQVRVILGYATGVIRGQVTVVGYDSPETVRLQISGHRIGDEERSNRFFAQTDDRGRFTIEGLASGEYELSANGAVLSSSGSPIAFTLPSNQRVIVTNGAESAVTLVVKVIERKKAP